MLSNLVHDLGIAGQISTILKSTQRQDALREQAAARRVVAFKVKCLGGDISNECEMHEYLFVPIVLRSENVEIFTYQ